MVGRLIVLILTVLIAVHGYFYLAFGALDPCTAATFKIANKGKPETGNGDGLVFSARLETAIRGEGWLTCYWAGITGDAPESIPEVK